MKKQFCALLGALCLSVSLAVPAGAVAATPASAAEAVQVVNALGIMVGDAGGMNLTAQVNRAEFVTMAVKATPGGDQVGQAATSPYPDVSWKHWAAGYVEAGVAAGLISGYSDGTFRPTNPITLAEGASIVLKLLGYGAEDFSGSYPTGQLAMYRSLKLDRGVAVSAAEAPLTRQDAMYLFYNMMTAPTKGGGAYLQSLGYSLNSAGEIDLVALINGAMEGPVVAQGNWSASVPFSTSGATVYREGKVATLNSIQDWDVVYWNKGMNTLWAYSDKVTGTIQALAPSTSNPASVTVAGRECTIETSAAAYALSDLGEYALGDTVTLLLGRTGGVAAVAKGSASLAGEQVGLVTGVDGSTYTDGKGGSYTARTITLLATDGQSYRYECKSAMRVGSLAQVTVSGQGEVTVRTLPTNSLTGKVDAAGTKVGDYSFASGVEILDVSDWAGVRIYPSRLAGLSLNSSAVRYYTRNSKGEIDRMVLNDVTGDMHLYGILTKMETVGSGALADYYSYEMDLQGKTVALPQTNSRYLVERGPIQVKGTVDNPEKLYRLTDAGTGAVSGNQFVVGNQKFNLSENVVVYEKKDQDYFMSTLARVKDGGYTLTGWYDKNQGSASCIRILVAQAK